MKDSKPPAQLLVVEDNATNMMIFRDILTAEGHLVLEATTAEDAFSIAHSRPLDLILMDIQLPGMDGLDAVKPGLLREGEQGLSVAIPVGVDELAGVVQTLGAAPAFG